MNSTRPFSRNVSTTASWLEQNARAHESVLQAAAAVTTIVPLRFGAIYRSREHVGRMLDERGDQFVATLERVRGHVELGVKVWVDGPRLERTLVGRLGAVCRWRGGGVPPAAPAGAGAVSRGSCPLRGTR